MKPFAIPSETQEQCATMKWARLQPMPAAFDVEPGSKVSDYLWHTPNGGKRSKITASHLKAMGVMPGVYDFTLGLGRGGFLGLFVEMKALDGTESDDQCKFGERMSLAGYCTVVARGALPAIDAIRKYLSLPPTLKDRTNASGNP
jgi:hypothetical protein